MNKNTDTYIKVTIEKLFWGLQIFEKKEEYIKSDSYSWYSNTYKHKPEHIKLEDFDHDGNLMSM